MFTNTLEVQSLVDYRRSKFETEAAHQRLLKAIRCQDRTQKSRQRERSWNIVEQLRPRIIGSECEPNMHLEPALVRMSGRKIA